VSIGPVEFLALKFPGNQFRGEILPALTNLVEADTIRVVDLLFVQKSANEEVRVIELTDLGTDDFAAFDMIVSQVSGLIGHDDAQMVANALEPNSSAALMLFENVWALRFVDAVADAKGEVLMSERIPRAMLDEMVASAAA
jgi:hypothetical protein